MVRLKNIFEKNEVELLSTFKGKKLHRVLVDYPWCHNQKINFDLYLVTHIVMEFDEVSLLLQNKFVDEPQDKDEYPIFKIQVTSQDVLEKKHKIMKTVNNKPVFDRYEPFKWFEFEIGQNVTNIQIYRDHAKWGYIGNIWDITMDVALRLSSEDHNFLFVLQDSIGGLITVHHNYEHKEKKLVDEFWCHEKWGMKCEKTSYLNRSIIVV